MRKIVLGALLAGMATQAGCFGSFALTNKLYQFNDGVSDSMVVKEILFLAMVIVPVYEIGMLGDAIILNLVEFLTGSNPLADASGVMEVDGAQVYFERTRKGIDVVTVREGVEERRSFRRGDGSWEVVDATGARIAWLEQDSDGGVRVVNAAGEPLAQYSDRDVDQLVASAYAGGWSGMLASLRTSSHTLVAGR